MIKNKRFSILLVVLLMAAPFVVIISILVGTADISAKIVFQVLWNAVFNPGSTEFSKAITTIILKLRIPRTLLALLSGAALGTGGTILQCLFRNPMADPYVMGLSSGAAFGVSIGIISGITHPLLIQLSSFSGAMASVFLVLIFAGIAGGQGNSLVILLSGIAVSLFFSSFMSLIMYLNHDQAEKIIFWTFGSFSGASWNKVSSIIWVILPGLVVLLMQWKNLNLLSQGDEAARSLGINPKRIRIFLLVITSLITAVTVSVTGIIGFVGLMIPHALRMITGPNHKTLLPLSALGGALFLVVSDIISRIILSPAEIPVGIITSLIGAPYLLFIIIVKRRTSI